MRRRRSAARVSRRLMVAGLCAITAATIAGPAIAGGIGPLTASLARPTTAAATGQPWSTGFDNRGVPGGVPAPAATPTKAPAAVPAVTRSGLPWASGSNDQGFASYRGRTLDVLTTWEDDGTWTGTESVWVLRNGAAARFPGRMSIAVPMLANYSNSLSACAAGAYDSHFTALGNTLKRYNRADSWVRLGWEGNGDWYPWSVGDNPRAWVSCFQREVRALRAADPKVRIEWDMSKDSSVNAATMYPGNAYVDVIGVDFYDMYPHYNDQASWNADYNSTLNGGPHGLGAWLSFAKSHGKKLAVPEWGVNNGGGDGGTDNPLYIQNMYNFFRANAASIAYESYFNSQCPDFCLLPAGKNPKASVRYQQLWRPAAKR